MQHGIDAPAGFIGADDRTAADLGTQGRVGRAGHAGGPMQCLHEAPRGDGQPEALAQQRRDLLERDTNVLVQEHNEGDRAGPQVHVKALFMTVWCPDSRSVESNCGIPRG